MERALQELAEAQGKIGHEVYVITSKYGASDRPVTEILNGVRIFRVNAWRLYHPVLTVPKNLPENALRKADIVHVHSHLSLFSMKVLSWASNRDVNTACYFMAVDAFRNHPNWFMRFFASYYDEKNIRRALFLADLRLVKNLRDKKILREKYGVETEYLPDAIPESYFTIERRDPTGFLEKYGIRQDKFFLFIGRMHRLKGPHVLVKALKHLGNDIATVFIGPDDGFLRETLKLASKLGIKDRVYVLGYVSEKDKIWAIDSAIALVLPSISEHVEAYSIVISEAWAREKPVIGSRVGVIPYRIKHGMNGLLVNPSDPKALAEAMIKLASDKELATEMGKQGKTSVLSWNDVALKSIELYEHAIGQ
ncbi:MAG: glycosyltransferase family 4 protein [Candidatus Bathyarchaeia archaeon]